MDESGNDSAGGLNRALQAGQKLLGLLEFSKQALENVIERTPDVFVVLDAKGRVLKGNVALARLLGVAFEEMIGLDLAAHFPGGEWPAIREALARVLSLEWRKSGSPARVDFETKSLDADGRLRAFAWSMGPLMESGAGGSALATLYGRDVSRIRQYEERLQSIFSAIPLGIMLVDAQGRVEPPASRFARILLSSEEPVGKRLREVLFDPAWPLLSETEREGCLHLLNCVGGSAIQFEMNEDWFPRKIRFPGKGGNPGEAAERSLALIFQPVVRDDVVRGLLVVVEDVTSLEEAQRLAESTRNEESELAAFLRASKHGDPSLLSQMLHDGVPLMARIEEARVARERAALARALHGIKGITRINGFTDFARVVHELETRVLSVDGDACHDVDATWKGVDEVLNALGRSWDALSDVVGLFTAALAEGPSRTNRQAADDGNGESNERPRTQGGEDMKRDVLATRLEVILSECRASFDPFRVEEAAALLRVASHVQALLWEVSSMPIEGMEPALRAQVRTTAEGLGKDVVLAFHWSGIAIDHKTQEVLKECLLHLLNNAVDHGIEADTRREAAGKPRVGRIDVRALCSDANLIVSVEDDGAGIDARRVVAKAVERGLLTEQVAARLTDAEGIQLILRPGFSTADAVTLVSGRGVGLDAVATSVAGAGGRLAIERNTPSGTRFVITLPSAGAGANAREAVPQKAQSSLAPVVPLRVVPDVRVEAASAHAAETTHEEMLVPVDAPVLEAAPAPVPVPVPVTPIAPVLEATPVPTHEPVPTVESHSLATPAVEGAPVAAPAPSEPPRVQPEVRAVPTGKGRILVVDDSSSVRKSIGSALKKAGHQVTEAVDGADGFEKLVEGEFDLVLTDQNMPNMDGITMCARFSGSRPGHGTPIFMITTETSAALKKAGKAAGIVAWIVKPFDESNLLRAVEKVIGRKAA